MNEFEVGRLVARLVGDSSSYTRMMREVDHVTKDISSSVERHGTMMVNSMMKVTEMIGTEALRAFTSFNHALTESTAMMFATAQQTEEMSEAALKLSQTAARGPKDLAESFYYMAGAGMNAAQSIGALPTILDFAMAGAFSMEEATDRLTTAQFSLGMASENVEQHLRNLTHIGDALVFTANKATGSVRQFAVALTRDAATTASTFGISLEETMAALAAYGKSGIHSSLAGGSFGRAIRLLGVAYSTSAEEQKKFGFQIFDQTGKFRNLADIMDNLRDVLKKYSAESRAVILKQMGFEALSQRAILPLLDKGGFMRDFQKELMEKAGGGTKEIAAKQMESFSNQMKMIRNQIEVRFIALGGMIAPTVLHISKLFAENLPYAVGIGAAALALFAKAAQTAFGGVYQAGAGVVEFFRSNAEEIADFFKPVITALVTIGVVAGAVFQAVLPTITALGSQIASFGSKGMAQAVVMTMSRVAAAMIAFRLFTVAVGVTMGVLRAFGIAQVVSTTIWLTWGSIVAGTTAIITFYNVVLAALTVTTAGVGTATGVLGGIFTTFKVIVATTEAAVNGLKVGMALLQFAFNGIALVGRLAGGAVLFLIDNLDLVTQGIKAPISLFHLFTNWVTMLGRAFHALWLGFDLTLMGAYATFTAASASASAGLAAANTASAASFVALQASLAPVLASLGAFAITAGVVIAGLGIAKLFFRALADTAYELVASFDRLGMAFNGPLSHITKMLGEWYDMLMQVVEVAKTDMPAAWDLAKKGLAVAIEDMKALWTPLWQRIERGAEIVASIVGKTFMKNFNIAIADMAKAYTENMPWFMQLGAGPRAEFDAVKAAIEWDHELGKAKDKLTELIGEDFIVPPTPDRPGAVGAFDTAVWEAAIKRTNAEIAELEEYLKPQLEPDKILPGVGEQFDDIGNKANKAAQAVKNLDNVLAGSADATARIHDYHEALYQIPIIAAAVPKPEQLKMPRREIEDAVDFVGQVMEQMTPEAIQAQFNDMGKQLAAGFKEMWAAPEKLPMPQAEEALPMPKEEKETTQILKDIFNVLSENLKAGTGVNLGTVNIDK
jgi:TP901 family phage tail tape measure protein